MELAPQQAEAEQRQPAPPQPKDLDAQGVPSEPERLPLDDVQLPCGHFCMCRECTLQVAQKKPVCPVCRVRFSRYRLLEEFLTRTETFTELPSLFGEGNDEWQHIKEPDQNRQTQLHQAARSGDTLTAEVLLRKGDDVNALNLRKRTPLHLASENGHADTVEALIEGGAAVDARDWVRSGNR
ncbi:hypothetical protein CYMTET_11797 [Cymbomonas tetramitiformis]|uniref:Uncharacterized protein n=1 Tax=Cymbomonas tetramitiformis TaxID=36881 RepID=A0AAE0LD44_9CHLO|nr:hypothetical protein CYMTET_11797 [Cymbomonas tetramitiformis]